MLLYILLIDGLALTDWHIAALVPGGAL